MANVNYSVEWQNGHGGLAGKIMVGASGLEPPTSWSRTMRASQTALRPDLALTMLLNCIIIIANPLLIVKQIVTLASLSFQLISPPDRAAPLTGPGVIQEGSFHRTKNY